MSAEGTVVGQAACDGGVGIREHKDDAVRVPGIGERAARLSQRALEIHNRW